MRDAATACPRGPPPGQRRVWDARVRGPESGAGGPRPSEPTEGAGPRSYGSRWGLRALSPDVLELFGESQGAWGCLRPRVGRGCTREGGGARGQPLPPGPFAGKESACLRPDCRVREVLRPPSGTGTGTGTGPGLGLEGLARPPRTQGLVQGEEKGGPGLPQDWGDIPDLHAGPQDPEGAHRGDLGR